MYKHGHARGRKISRTFYSWQDMKKRCYNEKNKSYFRYGGRGITVCRRWLESFENFLADMGECPEEMTLDRIDNDGNYEPLNCKWSTKSEQAFNRNTKGKYRCVSKTGNRWRVRIGPKNNRKHIGCYETELEAANAYNIYVIENNLPYILNKIP